MKKQKKESEKMSESLAKKAKRAKSAYSAPSIATPADARLNPSPSVAYEPPATTTQTGKKEKRKKTKGILFRMTPELYLELDRCAYTDRESGTITRILTRGAVAEIQRIRAKYPEGLKTRPLDELSPIEKELLG